MKLFIGDFKGFVYKAKRIRINILKHWIKIFWTILCTYSPHKDGMARIKDSYFYYWESLDHANFIVSGSTQPTRVVQTFWCRGNRTRAWCTARPIHCTVAFRLKDQYTIVIIHSDQQSRPARGPKKPEFFKGLVKMVLKPSIASLIASLKSKTLKLHFW